MADIQEALKAARKMVAYFEEDGRHLAGQATEVELVARAFLSEHDRQREEIGRWEIIGRAFGFGREHAHETIGWRGTLDEKGRPLSERSAMSHCEFCYQGNEDCTLIAHSDDCPVTLLRSALSDTTREDTPECICPKCGIRYEGKTYDDQF